MPKLIAKNQKNAPKQRAKMKAIHWSEGISQQKQNTSFSVNAKFVPLSLIDPDPENSRALYISEDEVLNGPKLTPELINDNTKDALDLIQKDVDQYFAKTPDSEQKINAYISILSLGITIGSPDNLEQPIKIKPNGNRFQVVFGHRRRLAHIVLNAKEILCIIEGGNKSELSHALSQFKENNNREDLDLKGELKAISRIKRAWEGEHNKTISINILRSLTALKKTKAAWFLAVIKDKEKSILMDRAIESGVVSSLQIAYYLSAMHSDQAKNDILNELLSGRSYNHSALLKRIQNPDLAVRSPDPLNKNDHFHGLKLTKKTNIKPISKIIRVILNTPEMRSHQKQFTAFNLETKEGILSAWENLCDLFNEDAKQ